METLQPDLAIDYFCKGVWKRNAAVFDGLDFRPFQRDAALIGFFHGVVKASLFVLCNDLYTF